MNALELAIKFHETYERLAPSFGYETRTETRTFDPESKNGKLMVAVCGELQPIPGSVPAAMEVLRTALQNDEHYAWVWHCNIAMSMYDEMNRRGRVFRHGTPAIADLHKLSDDAAARFMKLCFDVDTSAPSKQGRPP